MSASRRRHAAWLRALSIVAVGFGLLTLREGGMTLGGDEDAVKAAGNYVPFVLWFNFLAGFAYIVAGLGLWLGRRWAARLAIGIAVATTITFAAFGLHVYSGGAFEMRTVVAMSLRTAVWAVIATASWRLLSGRNGPAEAR